MVLNVLKHPFSIPEQEPEIVDHNSLQAQRKILEYIQQFMNKDKYNSILFCQKWDGTNGIRFRDKLPEDFVIELLGKISMQKKKVYLKSYTHFRNSIYFHLKHIMLDYFNCRNTETEEEEELIEDGKLVYSLKNKVELSEVSETEFVFSGEEDLMNSITEDEMLAKILSLFNPEKEAEEIEVFKYLFYGYKRSEMAEHLNISEREITNIQKRVRRKIQGGLDKNILEGLKNGKGF